MDTSTSKFYFLLFLLSILINVYSSADDKQLNETDEQTLKPHNKQSTTQHDFIFMQPPITTLPTNPVTTPSTGTTLPTPIVTVPSPYPTGPITFPPATQNPVTPSGPITNPVTTPSTTFPAGPQPVTNPVTTYPPGTAAPAVTGQSWCVAKSGVPETAVQVALDYACGVGGADCSGIQQGASCYNPNSLQNHASYAFNSYYQRNPVQTSCDFGGVAMITNANPSSGSCIFTTGSSSSASTTPTSPATTATPIQMPTPPTLETTPVSTPTTESSSGATPSGSLTPPIFLNTSSPSVGSGIAGGYGDSPPTANVSSTSSGPSNFQPFIGCVIVVIMTTMITWRNILNI